MQTRVIAVVLRVGAIHLFVQGIKWLEMTITLLTNLSNWVHGQGLWEAWQTLVWGLGPIVCGVVGFLLLKYAEPLARALCPPHADDEESAQASAYPWEAAALAIYGLSVLILEAPEAAIAALWVFLTPPGQADSSGVPVVAHVVPSWGTQAPLKFALLLVLSGALVLMPRRFLNVFGSEKP